jgi:hypothetical protein
MRRLIAGLAAWGLVLVGCSSDLTAIVKSIRAIRPTPYREPQAANR